VVWEPRTRTQGAYGSGHGGMLRVFETDGWASGEALQRRSVMKDHVVLCHNRFQSPSWHHEEDLFVVRFRQGEVHRRNRETCRKNIFDFKCLKRSTKNVFRGTIGSDGLPIRLHYRRLMADRTTQEVQKNDFVVDVDSAKSNVKTTAAPKCAQDGIDGNLCQKGMCLIKFARARH